MSEAEKKESPSEQEEELNTPSPETSQEDSEDSGNLLNKRIEELEAELAEANDRMLRALAEAENTKRRITKEKEDAVKFAAANFARNLLNVTDNFRRAIESVENTDEDFLHNETVKGLIQGIKAIEREMLQTFELATIRKIEAIGKEFDPNLHEVMFEVETDETPEGHVVQVIQDGYMMHDRLLRPARVGVAKNITGGKEPPPQSVDTMA